MTATAVSCKTQPSKQWQSHSGIRVESADYTLRNDHRRQNGTLSSCAHAHPSGQCRQDAWQRRQQQQRPITKVGKREDYGASQPIQRI